MQFFPFAIKGFIRKGFFLNKKEESFFHVFSSRIYD